MRPALFVLLVAVGLGAPACGEDGPTIDTGVGSEAVRALAISPTTNLLKLGASERYTLVATMSSGRSEAVACTWRSDATVVATVDGSGRVTAVAPGEATIVADYMGQNATLRVRVVPDHQGTWIGDWQVTGCSDTGDWARSDVEYPWDVHQATWTRPRTVIEPQASN